MRSTVPTSIGKFVYLIALQLKNIFQSWYKDRRSHQDFASMCC